MANLKNNEILESALKYAERGCAVIPVKGKVPYTAHGSKDATTDADQITRWWTEFPDANVGIATGDKSGIVVIDIDVDEVNGEDGHETLKEWEYDHGNLPNTWCEDTGRGGRHIFYRIPEGMTYKNTANALRGVDIRGNGGYVVVAPSIHPNGRPYEWDLSPDDIGLATADDNVQAFIDSIYGKNGTLETVGTFHSPHRIPEGERNQTLYKMACSLQSKGYEDETIREAVKMENRAKCVKPLSDREVEQLVNSALSNKKGGSYKIPVAGEGWHEPALQLNKDGEPYKTISNIAEAIEYDAGLYKHIKYNTLAYAPCIVGSVPWDKDCKYREWKNSDDSHLRAYLEDHYGFKQKEKINDAFEIVTSRNQFNPICETLKEIHKDWDGQTGHIRKLLPDYLGCEDTEYNYQVMKTFMLGAINRVFRAGCKFDYMIIMYGEQGTGKSTFLKRMAIKDEWYLDNLNCIEGDEASEKLRGYWIIEMAELQALKTQKGNETIKAFVTTGTDSFRPPYQRRTEKFPRVCVFAGTTNDNTFLSDQTGNRRFLPITTRNGHAKKDLFNEADYIPDIKQAWAEAMQLWYETPDISLVLDADVQKQAEAEQERYMTDDGRIGIIQDWLDNYNGDAVCVLQIWKEALKMDTNPRKGESNEIGTLLSNQIKGWVKPDRDHQKKSIPNYGQQRVWIRDSNFYEATDSPF